MTATLPERRSLLGPAVRVFEHHLLVYRRVWKSNVLGSVIRPLLYVLGMGLGVGSLVDDGPRADTALEGLTYFEFFAPAIMATTAMQILTNDALWPIRGGFVWFGTYHNQRATPIDAGDVVTGVLLWHLAKGVLSAGGVAVVLLLFDGTRTAALLPAVVFAAFAGIAYSAPLIAFSASRETDLAYPNIQRFVIVPMFLFSGAFYPIDQLPGWMQTVTRLTPIWHGVELCRGVVHGSLEFVNGAGHLAYLLVWLVVGYVLSRRVFTAKLGV